MIGKLMIGQHTLKPHPGAHKKFKRLGRGDASGKGSFSTRGVKGQLSRSGGRRRPGFEGGQTPLIRRMPKLKGFKPPSKTFYQVVNIQDLNQFPEGSEITKELLLESGLISKKNRPVKILGDGELKKMLKVKADAFSQAAKQKIQALKGEALC